MRSTKLMLLTAASLTCVAPAFATPQAPMRASASSPAQALSPGMRIGGARAGKPMGGSSSLTGGNGLGIAMLAVVLGGAAWAAYEMINGDDNEEPASP